MSQTKLHHILFISSFFFKNQDVYVEKKKMCLLPENIQGKGPMQIYQVHVFYILLID